MQISVAVMEKGIIYKSGEQSPKTIWIFSHSATSAINLTRKIMPLLKDSSRAREQVTSHGKEEWRLKMELRLLTVDLKTERSSWIIFV